VAWYRAEAARWRSSRKIIRRDDRADATYQRSSGIINRNVSVATKNHGVARIKERHGDGGDIKIAAINVKRQV